MEDGHEVKEWIHSSIWSNATVKFYIDCACYCIFTEWWKCNIMLWWRFRKHPQTTFKVFSLKWQENKEFNYLRRPTNIKCFSDLKFSLLSGSLQDDAGVILINKSKYTNLVYFPIVNTVVIGKKIFIQHWSFCINCINFPSWNSVEFHSSSNFNDIVWFVCKTNVWNGYYVDLWIYVMDSCALYRLSQLPLYTNVYKHVNGIKASVQPV